MDPQERSHSLPNPPQPTTSQDMSHDSSATATRPASVSHDQQHKKPHPRVKFSVGSNEDDDQHNPSASTAVPHITMSPSLVDTDMSADVTESPSLRDPDWTGSARDHWLATDREMSAQTAQARARLLATRLSRSAPGSRRNSLENLALSPASSPTRAGAGHEIKLDDIPLMDLGKSSKSNRPYSLYDDSTDDDLEGPDVEKPLHVDNEKPSNEASRLVRAFTRRNEIQLSLQRARATGHISGTATPAVDQNLVDYDYIPPPSEYKTGVLASLLKLYGDHGAGAPVNRHSTGGPSTYNIPTRKELPHDERARSLSDTPGSSPQSSGRATPKRPKWYDKSSNNASVSSLVGLLASSAGVAPAMPSAKAAVRPDYTRPRSSGMIASAVDKITHPGQWAKHHKPRLEDEIQITVHIAEVLARQRYLIKLCRCLMLYGAPTHRLEEYMRASARVLLIDGQFLYLPGCMIISFDDPDTHTTEVKLVKEPQGVDLGKLEDVWEVYKAVTHDKWGVEEAIAGLEEITSKEDKFSRWRRVLVYGLASVCVGPFAFGARPIDMPIIFVLGCLLGFMQLVVAPASDQFQHVFEVAAAVATSFLSRAFGTITYRGEYLFCFSAMAQSSIALILPGYIILCASLELQSRNIVAGSVRMVYAIIYSLFLGFGITIGTALFGLMDANATSDVTCAIPAYWSNTYVSHFPFVPLFTLCLIMLNQAKWRQAPAMLVIAFAGYQVNFWSSKRFANNVQVANALGAFIIGTLSNLYSRNFHKLAATAMLPAIFVQVPSGLAASGSLVAGLTSANQITGNATGISVINNGTAGFYDAQNGTSATESVYGGTIFNVGYGMIQVAIGISVGLFLSALVIYPFGKRRSRSGLFSF